MTTGQQGFLVLWLSLFTIGATQNAAPATCPSGWTLAGIDRTCIKVYTDTKSWTDARAACKAHGADLLKIEHSNMNGFVWEEIMRQSDPEEAHWIGLHDLHRESKFHWLDEPTEAKFKMWDLNQPNNLAPNDQDCVEIGRKGFTPMTWNDQRCEVEARFICELPLGGPCPTRWTKLPYADTCVKWYGDAERKSWEDARAACKQVGADLVKIANFSMNYYIFDFVSSRSANAHWVGLHNLDGTNNFKWLDETEKAEFEAWAPHQPHDPANSRCVEIGHNGHIPGSWNDQRCSVVNGFVCEKATCPSGWMATTAGTCIKIHDEQKTWESARKACKKEKADLVKIADSTVNGFIWAQVYLTSGDAHWIGLHDVNGDDKFRWLDEADNVDRTDYVPWAPNQPSHMYGNTEQDCVEIGSKKFPTGAWNDKGCALESNFICEQPLSEATEGSATAGSGSKGSTSGTGSKGSSAGTGSTGSSAGTGSTGSSAGTGSTGSSAGTGSKGSSARTGAKESTAGKASGSKGSSAGAVAGTVIGVLIACTVLAAAAFFGRRYYITWQTQRNTNLDSAIRYTNTISESA